MPMNRLIPKSKKIPAFQEFNFIYPETEHYMSYALNTECKEAASAMLPVWFLSYRNKDRVAYATVNGQTGKVAADIPVDRRKFLLGSFLLAIPVFLLLNLFLYHTACFNPDTFCGTGTFCLHYLFCGS